MKNKIEDLRNHMFAALEKLSEAETPEQIEAEIKRSQQIAELGKVVVDAAKTEVMFAKVTKAEIVNTDFFDGVKKLNS